MRVIAITTILLLSMGNTVTNAREILRLGVFNDLRGFVPAMEIALETIRNDKTLPFTFDVTFNFTMVRYTWMFVMHAGILQVTMQLN